MIYVKRVSRDGYQIVDGVDEDMLGTIWDFVELVSWDATPIVCSCMVCGKTLTGGDTGLSLDIDRFLCLCCYELVD